MKGVLTSQANNVAEFLLGIRSGVKDIPDETVTKPIKKV
jgi:hypothetical protein